MSHCAGEWGPNKHGCLDPGCPVNKTVYEARLEWLPENAHSQGTTQIFVDREAALAFARSNPRYAVWEHRSVRIL